MADKSPPFGDGNVERWLGSGSSLKVIDDNVDGVPDEVKSFVEANGLGNIGFTCILRHVPKEGSESAAMTAYLKTWTRTIPPIEYIIDNYGPGNYILQFKWEKKVETEDGAFKTRNCMESVPISISDKAMPRFKAAQLRRQLEVSAELRESMRNNKVNNAMQDELVGSMLEIDNKSSPEDPMKKLRDTIEMLKGLGISVGQQPVVQQPTIQWDKILMVLGALVPLGVALIENKKGEAQSGNSMINGLMTMLLAQSKEANTQLISMLQNNKSQTGVERANEYLDIIKETLDVKNMLNPPQRTVADRIFDAIEGMVPSILQVAGSVAAARSNPMVSAMQAMATKTPEYKEIKNNPAEVAKLIERMDDYFGWRQTDLCLDVMFPDLGGRPANCPRDPAKEHPVAEREEVVDGEIEGETVPE